MPNNEIFGQAVDIAAHMATTASPDQIVTDDATVKSLSPELKSRCSKLGETSVKELDEPFSYYGID